MSKKNEEEKIQKVQKVKRPIDKGKIAQSVIILVIVGAMLLSTAGTLIYYIFNS